MSSQWFPKNLLFYFSHKPLIIAESQGWHGSIKYIDYHKVSLEHCSPQNLHILVFPELCSFSELLYTSGINILQHSDFVIRNWCAYIKVEPYFG